MITLIEPPLHQPRTCPTCRNESRAIVDRRCLCCRTNPSDIQSAEAADAERAAITRARFNLPWVPAPQLPPVDRMAGRSPARCDTCGEAKWTVVDGNCMACRTTLGLDARPC